MTVQEVGTIESLPASITAVISLIVVRLEMAAEVVVSLIRSTAKVALMTGFRVRRRRGRRRVVLLGRHPSCTVRGRVGSGGLTARETPVLLAAVIGPGPPGAA